MENFQGSLKRAFRQAGPDPLMRIGSLVHRSKAACKGCALLQDQPLCQGSIDRKVRCLGNHGLVR